MKNPMWKAAEAAYLLLLPPILYVLLDISLVNQDNFVDPLFYTGYGRIFPLLYELHGWPYYAVRFPVIALNELFTLTLPPLLGYAALRYLIVVLSGGLLYLWARQRFGVSVAALSYLFLIANPLFLRIILWDLTIFISVPMALAGISVWMTDWRRTALNRFVAGMLFLFSVTSHAFTGTALLVFLIVVGIRRLVQREVRDLLRFDIAMTGLGALVAFGLGVLYYYLRLGVFEPLKIITVTASVVGVGHNYGLDHSARSLEWLAREYHVYVPLLCILALAATRRLRLSLRSDQDLVWWFALAYGTAYALYQFAAGSFVLETFYYFSHLTLIVYLAVPVIMDAALRGLLPARRAVAVAAVAAVLVLLPLAEGLMPSMIDRVQAVARTGTDGALWATFACVVLALSMLFPIGPSGAVGIARVVVIFAVAQILTLVSPSHRVIYSSSHEAREHGVYRATIDFLDLYGAYGGSDSRTLVWYPRNQFSGQAIASSVLLYTFHQPWSGEGLPVIDTGTLERLAQIKPRYLLLMSEDSSQIDAGRAALRQNAVETRLLEARDGGDAAYRTYFELHEICSAPGLPAGGC